MHFTSSTALLVALAAVANAQITLVGNLQHLIGQCGDWSPPCADSVLIQPTNGDSFFKGTFFLPAGFYEYKVAIGGSWNVNYGLNGVSFGPNIPLYVPIDSNVTFVYDTRSNWIFDSVSSPFYYVVGDLQTLAGCSQAGDVACLAAQIYDTKLTGRVSLTIPSVPAGSYSVSLYDTSSLQPDHNADLPPFSVVVPGPSSSDVTFDLVGTTVSVNVGGIESASKTVRDIPKATDFPEAGPAPGPVAGCLQYPRQHFLKQNVQAGAFEYRGNSLYGQIKVQNIGFQKTVSVIYQTADGDFSHVCAAEFGNPPYQGNYETWKFACDVPANVTQFYIKYDVNGQSFYDNNNQGNYQVSQASPYPYTKGFQRDISHYFQRDTPRAKKYLLQNIHPANTSAGVVVAAPQKQVRHQNYFYHWIRDGSLTMDVVRSLYAAGDKTLEQTLWDHAAFTHTIQNINALTGLGEPKFNVDGTDYVEPWNDGPAFRSSLFIRFANDYLANGGSLDKVKALYDSADSGVIKPDLEYIAANYRDFNTCDLWEETTGDHFFTTMAIRKALYEGAAFATKLNDADAAARYSAAAADLDTIVSGHWDAQFGVIASTFYSDGSLARLLDAAIPLGVIHGYTEDGLFGPADDRVLATLYEFALGMMVEYRLNLNTMLDDHNLPMGVAIGRYYGDHYDGVETTTQGNPWYLTTAAYAEVYYRAAQTFVKRGSIDVTELNIPFFSAARPAGLAVNGLTAGTTLTAGTKDFQTVVNALIAVGDSYMRRVRFYAAADARLPEEFNRDCGQANGVDDLTWSYAAYLSAGFARSDVLAIWTDGV